MFNKISFIPTEDIHPVCLALDDYEDIEPNGSISQTNDVIDVKDVIYNRIKKDKPKKEFNKMLKAALEEHVTIKCHNDGCHIRVRVYFDDEEICMGSCETDV